MGGTGDDGIGPRPRGDRIRWIGPVMAGSALALTVAMIAVGAFRTATPSRGGSAEAFAPSSTAPSVVVTPRPSADPEPRVLADLSFVDIRSGRVTPLPRTVRSIEGLGRLDVSPDGARLAFDGTGGLYVAGIDGQDVRLIPFTAGASAPSWSHDGRKLVYGDGSRLFVVDLPTERVDRIAAHGTNVWYPNFSPDDRTIVFTKQAAGGLELWTVPVSGGHDSLLLRLDAPQTNAAFGTYSPQGRIAFRLTQYDGVTVTQMTEATVRIADADGEHRRPVADAPAWMSQIDPERLWPTWSPDGSAIAFERLYGRAVVIVDVRTGRLTKLGTGVDPVWLDNHTLIVEEYVPEGP